MISVSTRFHSLSSRLLARRPMTIPPEPAIATFTFDDFPRSALHVGGNEILGAYGWRATYYACAGYLGKTTTHHGPMFTADDIALLLQEGHEIGCHTHDHLDASTIAAARYLEDIERNAMAMRTLGVRDMATFAYPYGSVRPAHKRAVASRFPLARGIRPGVNGPRTDGMLLRAVALDGGDEGIARAIDHAATLARQGGWLIYFGHEVAENPGPWGCTPAQLTAVANAVRASGAEVLTMGAALDRLAHATGR